MGIQTRLSEHVRLEVRGPVSRIAEVDPNEGLFVESLMAAISQGSDEAKSLLEEFLTGRAPKVVVSEGAH